MMWMHGGGVQSGYSHEIEFDGDAFCRRGVILVTINYRLNILGYFAHPELSAESPHGASGNYGLHDQLQALRWIHDCIAAFGGDPDNVTIFGQSGGGRSTQALACSPLAKGLVKHAIVQSAGGVTTAFGGCRGSRWSSAGWSLCALPAVRTSLRSVRSLRRSWCRNCTTLAHLPRAWSSAWPGALTSAPTAMPCPCPWRTPSWRADSWIWTTCSAPLPWRPHEFHDGSHRGWATLQARTGLKAPYLYRFTRQLPEDDPADERPLKGAFHSSELWYTFGTLGRCWRPMTQADYA